MAKIEKTENIQMTDNKKDELFLFYNLHVLYRHWHWVVKKQ